VFSHSEQPALNVQAEAAAEAKLRGPHSFPLERLLATFWELRYAQGKTCPIAEELQDAQSNEVNMQISSLVSLCFLSQVDIRDWLPNFISHDPATF
jgi:hypothetical protein